LSIGARATYRERVHPYFEGARPRLFGHRGASGEAPENTLPSFDLAWRQGVRFLETDCHATRDGEIVVFHDATLERTTDGRGRLRDLSFEELQRLDAGFRFTPDGESFPYRGKGVRVPRLADVLAAFPDARVNLEVKEASAPVAARVLEVIRAARAEERVLLAADEPEILDRIRALEPRTALGSSREDVIAFYLALGEGRIESHRPRGHALQIPPSFLGRDLVTRESIAAAHALGLEIHVWTINGPGEMRALLEVGADGLMSDFPARLVSVARKLAPS
jgi:glycerophosphoryl diester phosphodiesterase